MSFDVPGAYPYAVVSLEGQSVPLSTDAKGKNKVGVIRTVPVGSIPPGKTSRATITSTKGRARSVWWVPPSPPMEMSFLFRLVWAAALDSMNKRYVGQHETKPRFIEYMKYNSRQTKGLYIILR
jgi:hypothetical protein